MISVEEAKEKIASCPKQQRSSSLKVSDALGYVLFNNILAPVNLPPFAQSAMDGYAVIAFDLEEGDKELHLDMVIQAGDKVKHNIVTGKAARIFTGAPVPDGATAVVMQEKTEHRGDMVLFREPVAEGTNIRNVGEYMQKGTVALPAGTTLNPAAIGLLNDLGFTEVTVFSKPEVELIVTGDELVKAGNPLNYGQIYESNSGTLTAALQSTGFSVAHCDNIKDNFEATKAAINQAIERSDVVILSGGISVGDYDFVGKAVKELQVEEVFYKIRQKPGKPMFFGKKGNTLIFALPGNPSASLLCYYMYVLPALRETAGFERLTLGIRTMPLIGSYEKKGDRAHFLKANLRENGVELLGGQSSATLHTFALADALVYVPAHINSVAEGQHIEVHVLH